jgi:hypothetical protein
MSGGHFDGQQIIISDIADAIERCIDSEVAYPERGLSSATLNELSLGVMLLRLGAVYAQRIDYLLEGDDGEESFHKRLWQELDEVLRPVCRYQSLPVLVAIPATHVVPK